MRSMRSSSRPFPKGRKRRAEAWRHDALELLATGQTLYAVGDEPTDFWVVAHGEVVCDYCDGSAPTTLKVGSYFGEVRTSSSTWVCECVSTRVRSTVR